MKIIFLDIDGVLNNRDSMTQAYKAGLSPSGIEAWDQESINSLKLILERTGAEIVISSTWRMGCVIDELACGFEKYDLPKWLDVTPQLWSSKKIRGDEIALWLKNNEVERFVIIDDDSDMLDEQKPFFVQTSFQNGGLTRELAEEVIRVLNEEEKSK